MSRPRTITLVVLLILTAGLCACDDSDSTRILGPQTEAAREEGMLAALWLSGELLAPRDLGVRIAIDLHAIRRAYADSVGRVREFRPPWVPSRIAIGANAEGMRKIREGSYPELEALNDLYGLTHLDTSTGIWDFAGVATLYFSGQKNPEVIARAYDQLSGLRYATAGRWSDDYPGVYPWFLDKGISYLFYNGWGDCPAGCINRIFHYVRVVDGEIEYVGRYHYWIEDEPAWWAEARRGYDAYYGRGG